MHLLAIEARNLTREFTIASPEASRSIRHTLLHMLTGKYRQRVITAVNNVSLSIEVGMSYGLMGPNGAGKTTLLKMVAGILPPTRGHVRVLGLNPLRDIEALKRRIAVIVALGSNLYSELTVKENLDFYARYMGFSRRERREKIKWALEFSELEEFADTKVKKLSSGMIARLAFARSFIHDPEVILIDEALAPGDEKFRKKALEFLLEKREEGKTFMVVTHDRSLAEKMCDIIAYMNRGVITEESKPQEHVEAPTQKMEILEVKLLDASSLSELTTVKAGSRLMVRVVCRANSEVSSPVVGIRVTDPSGSIVYGTNTWRKNVKLPELKAGDTLIVDFTQKLPLNSGFYNLTVAAHTPDSREVFDWRENILGFRVAPADKTSDGMLLAETEVSYRVI